ncbi:MAG: 2-oxoacid:acceptor oxidoreductase subunit alpha [Chlorobi bacterium]|nr:2-oxoacid:acceptor oxidoreductase subunit alpha [Chlorobiota bacterium]
MSTQREVLNDVVIRFAGDSGDGMQLVGGQFTLTAALVGNDLATLPDFPAEIRAPAGTTYGVSAFQLHFSSNDIHTPGDAPDVLVAMNPAALITNLIHLKPGGTIIINEDTFDKKHLELAGYASNPLDGDSLSGYNVIHLRLTTGTLKAVEGLGLSNKEAGRCKNFYTLGLLYWMYNRPMEPTLEWIAEKFKARQEFAEANAKALKAGYNLGETVEVFNARYEVGPAKLPPGKYRNITGNQATALGMVAATQRTGLKGFLGTYPITPASDILHYLSRYKNFGLLTFQAEDEIAAIGAAIGAAYGGALAFTTTAGPGIALKSEAIGLGVMTELPVVVCNIQRAGPSTGMPTKTEQSDLLQAFYGRNGEAPVPVVAPQTPGDCFWMLLEAARIATKYMVPVFFLSDGYLGNGAEPWMIPSVSDLPDMKVEFYTDPKHFHPYSRNEHEARPWAIPGTPGLEHRVGGLEKQHGSGGVSYDPENHEKMTRIRARKVAGIANDIPELEVYGDEEGEFLVLGWGSTYGAIRVAVDRMRAKGFNVSQAHLRYLNPMPKNTGHVLRRFKQVAIPELNTGQLAKLIRSEHLLDVVSWSKVQGLPFTAGELEELIEGILTNKNTTPESVRELSTTKVE